MNNPQNWVLIRGLARSRFHWVNFAEELKKNLNLHTVECVELGGNGFLSDQETPAAIDVAVESLRQQISPQQFPYGLIGVSLGGMLATRWAQLYPQEVSHLVVINSSSGLSPFHHRLMPQNYLSIFKNLLGRNAENLERFILKATSNKNENRIKFLESFVAFQKQHPVKLKNFVRQLKLSSQADFSQIPSAKKLVLVSVKDRLVNPACSEAIAKIWQCEIRRHPDAGHDLPLDDGPWIIQQIQNAR